MHHVLCDMCDRAAESCSLVIKVCLNLLIYNILSELTVSQVNRSEFTEWKVNLGGTPETFLMTFLRKSVLLSQGVVM